jgi:uncharacterized protein (TIGR02594 family)
MKATTKRQNKHLIKQSLWITSFLAVLIGCNPVPEPVDTAHDYIGLNEYQHRKVLKEFVGVDPVNTEWCAAFVNAILNMNNIPGSESVSDVPLMARSFLKWGDPVNPEDIQRGDIVVFPRGDGGWLGHVGFFIAEENGRWIILGGNQKNEVRYDYYKPSRALGIRRAKYTHIIEGDIDVGNDRKDGQ